MRRSTPSSGGPSLSSLSCEINKAAKQLRSSCNITKHTKGKLSLSRQRTSCRAPRARNCRNLRNSQRWCYVLRSSKLNQLYKSSSNGSATLKRPGKAQNVLERSIHLSSQARFLSTLKVSARKRSLQKNATRSADQEHCRSHLRIPSSHQFPSGTAHASSQPSLHVR